jgi:carbamoyltransferase
MYILGISGGPNSVRDTILQLPNGSFHDASAAIFKDGELIAAYEEERFTRIKHTNHFPARAIAECLKHLPEATTPDLIAFSVKEEFLYQMVKEHRGRKGPYDNAAAFVTEMLSLHCQWETDSSRIRFYDHHFCHAAGAYFQSGFEKSLVITIDGAGDGCSGRVYEAAKGQFRELHTISLTDSLGYYYLYVTRHLGFYMFDEYKVMGLAPYGDAEAYRDFFGNFYRLLPDGRFAIDKLELYKLRMIASPRQQGEEITQTHKDIAAALQESLEKIVFHMASHFRSYTGITRLCLAGGVALNCKMTGELLYSGMFEEIFVHPAAADNGLSIGAGLACAHEQNPGAEMPVLRHLYLGSGFSDCSVVEKEIGNWQRQISAKKVDDDALESARLLAANRTVGWFRGKAEFGPRALGNRSILADPRPYENREKINAIVKMREGFRPFAPSVLEELVDEYFEVPAGVRTFPFMTFVLKVRPQYRDILQAITHVDGTARIQTVSKSTNPHYWRLIHCYHDLTGVGMVLNTSFNSNVEPIVNTPKEAIVCFLTTNLDDLVMEGYHIRKNRTNAPDISDFVMQLPGHVRLMDEDGGKLENLYTKNSFRVSEPLSELIRKRERIPDTDEQLMSEIRKLLSLRMIDIVA